MTILQSPHQLLLKQNRYASLESIIAQASFDFFTARSTCQSHQTNRIQRALLSNASVVAAETMAYGLTEAFWDTGSHGSFSNPNPEPNPNPELTLSPLTLSLTLTLG